MCQQTTFTIYLASYIMKTKFRQILDRNELTLFSFKLWLNNELAFIVWFHSFLLDTHAHLCYNTQCKCLKGSKHIIIRLLPNKTFYYVT